MKQILTEVLQGSFVVTIITLISLIIVPALTKLALLYSNYLVFQLTDIQALGLAVILWIIAVYWLLKHG